MFNQKMELHDNCRMKMKGFNEYATSIDCTIVYFRNKVGWVVLTCR